jgi:hypothetical protein
MGEKCQYEYLGPWPGSHYRQYFYKKRKIRAETLYQATLGPDARSPEEVAADYDIPVAAVREAIHYCLHHEDTLRQDRERELENARSRSPNGSPPAAPTPSS